MRAAPHAFAGLRISILTSQHEPGLCGGPSLRAHMRSHCVQDDEGLRVTWKSASHFFRSHRHKKPGDACASPGCCFERCYFFFAFFFAAFFLAAMLSILPFPFFTEMAVLNENRRC